MMKQSRPQGTQSLPLRKCSIGNVLHYMPLRKSNKDLMKNTRDESPAKI